MESIGTAPHGNILDYLTCVADFERLANDWMPPNARAYIVGAACDECTLRDNCEAYSRIKLNQRVLHNSHKIKETRETATRLRFFDKPRPHPILLAPTACHKLVHPRGEQETLEGASIADAIVVISTLMSVPLEKLKACNGCARWLQLYVHTEEQKTNDRIELARQMGFEAVCLTVDTPLPGARNRENRVQWHFPPDSLAYPEKERKPAPRVYGFTEDDLFLQSISPSIDWSDVRRWRDKVKNGAPGMKFLVKGITTPDDAQLAIDNEVDGIVISNHGARNLDSVPATIDVLPSIEPIVRKSRPDPNEFPLLVDGGIRRGTDILKALAYGATAVLIGRPYLYGLFIGGAPGVATVVNILKRELFLAMALTGCRSLADIYADRDKILLRVPV